MNKKQPKHSEKNFARVTEQAYNQIAEKYAATKSDRSPFFLYVEKFLSYLKNNGRILDLGCGPGWESKEFSERGFETIGVDISEGMLRIARKNTPKASFYKMDMRKLDFPNKFFDGIWIGASLLHIPKKEAPSTLAEVRRVLKSRGVVFISLQAVRKGRVKEGFEVSDKYDMPVTRFWSRYRLEEAKSLVQKCGLKIIQGERKRLYKDEKIWILIFARKSPTLIN